VPVETIATAAPPATRPLLAGATAGLLIVLAALPFNLPLHHLPITTFESELVAIVGGLLLFALGLAQAGAGRAMQVSASALFWLLALAWTLATPLWTSYTFRDQWLVPAVVCATTALALLGLHQLRERFGGERLLRWLAIGLSVGGVWQVLAAGVQLAAPQGPLTALVFVAPASSRLVGNLGQANLLAHYLSWSSVALLWLTTCRFPGIGRAALSSLAWPLLALFQVAIAFSGSRSALLYLAGFFLLGLLAGRNSGPTSPSRRFGRRLLLLGLLGAGAQLAAAPAQTLIAQLAPTWQPLDSAVANLGRGQGGSFRWIELANAISIFREHPLLGVGWGNFAAHSHALHASQPAMPSESVLFTHSHNLLAQLMAELGLAGLAFGIAFILLALRSLRRPRQPADWALAALLGITLIHSLLEYPLWDFHFLLLFVLLAGTREPTGGRTFRAPGVIWPPLLAVAAGMLLVGYWQQFDAIRSNPWPSTNSAVRRAQQELLANASRIPGLEYAASSLLLNHLGTIREGNREGLPLAERLARFRPFPHVQLRLLCEYAYGGETARRNREWQRLAAAYPAKRAEAAQFLRKHGC